MHVPAWQRQYSVQAQHLHLYDCLSDITAFVGIFSVCQPLHTDSVMIRCLCVEHMNHI
jgi:hypothetical protein